MVTIARLNQRGLDCGYQTILGEKLVREADDVGGNTIQGLFTSDLQGQIEQEVAWKIIFYYFFSMYVRVYVYVYISLFILRHYRACAPPHAAW